MYDGLVFLQSSKRLKTAMACTIKHGTGLCTAFLHNFEIPFFFISDFIDVDEYKGNHSCHENANCSNTIGSHVCDCQPAYTGNGQNCTGEFGITRKCGHGLSFFRRLYNVFCAAMEK